MLSEDAPAKSNKRRKPNGVAKGLTEKKPIDDTPKQFARLMAWSKDGRALRKGLDDGIRKEKPKKTKKSAPKNAEGQAKIPNTGTEDLEQNPSANEDPTSLQRLVSATDIKILPGERLRDFGVRVDQSLPLSSVPKYSTRETLKIPGLKRKQNLTKHNKRLAKMQDRWREDDQRLKDKRAEALEEGEDKREEESLLWDGVEGARYARKGKRRKGGEDDGDIWKVLDRKEASMKERGLTAGDAVQEPPKLGRIKNIFKNQQSGS